MAGAKVAFLSGLPQVVVDAITPYTPEGWTTDVIDASLPQDEQNERLKDADFILVYRSKLTDEGLRGAPKARLVQLLAAGYDRMNLKLMRELEVPCANNGGANSYAVADHTVLLVLALYKQLLSSDKSTREGRWNEPITGTNTFEMADKVVGILGIGNIGKKVAKRVQGFDAVVKSFDLFPMPEDQAEELNIKQVSLEELFKTSDIITCHTPLTSDTYHIVNAERLAMMKPSAVLVNTSRGPVVDEQALIEALQQGKIAGAGLDVFEQEPVSPDNPLLKMDNVVATPHTAGTTWNTWFRRAQFAYENMARVWNGEAPQAIAQTYDIED
ncbi:MAG: 2-hydroxyacid dehydrogenase [Chloroflexi bacterium]|nr:2-hydroxyacid dehydrogenase [Chloroflexota bacterium]MDA1226741.1 2-hydroxyacid dehydrogenase [Chloroflexota bacterium]